MRALTFHAPFDVRCEERPEPRIEDPRDVVVRVELAAICGSDLHPYRGHEVGLDAGTVMGHELLGVVVSAGAEVERFRPGTRVVAPFTTSCGACVHCARGLTARCVHGQLFGWVERGHGLHGVQAERVRVPLADTTLVAVPDAGDDQAAVDEEVLLVGDVLATGHYCAVRGGVGPGSVVVVLGCGPVGLMAVVACRELGAARVFAVDRLPERLELAAGFGAEPVELGPPAGSGGPGGSGVASGSPIHRFTGGHGADAILEAVGTPEASELALELVRPGGTIAAVGVHTEPRFAFSPAQAYDKNLTYFAGRCPARAHMDAMLAVAARWRGRLAAIISHRLPLSEGVHGYRIFEQRLEGCTKVLLRPD